MTRQLNVASGNPPFVAVPVVLHPLILSPLNLVFASWDANRGLELPS